MFSKRPYTLGFIFAFSLIGAGCAKLAHLQELLTLKELSEDRDQQDVYVRNHDAGFERLLAAVKDGSIKRFQHKNDFLKEFGNPILIKVVPSSTTKPQAMWLYRYSTKAFGSPKVYLYFLDSGELKDFQYFSREQSLSASAPASAEATYSKENRLVSP